ncbi:glycoside hydrolase family 130 protein [Spirochaeta thermophila]|nr:glycoside hydrolase family 130 protein [Spirochaeta thermophila]
MSTRYTVVADPLPHIPWEDRPPGSREVVWRYSGNPIVTRDHAKGANSIFNSAVVPFKEGFAGVFRVDDTARRMDLRRGFSEDGIHWEIDDEPIRFTPEHPDLPRSEFKYDPRVVRLGSRYYITWCNGYHGPGIGLGYTDDFETFVQMESPFMPYNRNGVLFPRKIGDNYALLHRPSDAGHTAFGDIFYSESPDLKYWGRHRHVMGPRGVESLWQHTKIGAGPAPIETSEGWLLLYHGVLTSCNGFVYSMGAALLDLDEPWKVRYRSAHYLLSPRAYYECVGDVPNVVFPCAVLCDGETGRLAVYYGGADTVVALAFAYVDELIEFIKATDLGA